MVAKVTKELRTTKVKRGCKQDQENKIPDKVQVKKEESEQTDTARSEQGCGKAWSLAQWE